MKKDLDRIKKLYGEDFAKQFCRPNFSHLIEREDFSLADFLIKLIAPSRYFYEDLIKHNKQEDLKNAIWGLFRNEQTEEIYVKETPEELMRKAGYTLFKCETQEDIDKFKKYYAINEELCTFEDNQRINTHTIFWAVKNNATELKRENYPHPERQDEYGTSVLSIQFTKGFESTLAIINRYNSAVKYAESTFSNNLDKIYPGLTNSFQKHYGINLIKGRKAFNLPSYIADEFGTYHKCNNRIKSVSYCADNVIINNGKSINYDPTRFIIADYYIIDRKEKTIKLLEENEITDSFVEQFDNIKKIDSAINGENKIVKVWCENNVIEIVLNKNNQIIKLTNNNIKEIGRGFMQYCMAAKELVLEQVEKIENDFLTENTTLKKFVAPNLISLGDNAFHNNEEMHELELKNIKKIGNYCFTSNNNITQITAPKLESVGKSFMSRNNNIKEIHFPKLRKIDIDFMKQNRCATRFSAPLLDKQKYSYCLNEKFLKIKRNTIISKMVQTIQKLMIDEDLIDMY